MPCIGDYVTIEAGAVDIEGDDDERYCRIIEGYDSYVEGYIATEDGEPIDYGQSFKVQCIDTCVRFWTWRGVVTKLDRVH